MFDHVAGGAQAASRKGADAGLELLQAEGFGHVIVGAMVQPFHALFDGIGCSQHQHRQRRTTGAQSLEDLQAMQIGQAEIENEQVEFVMRHQRRIGLRTGRDVVDCSAGSAQAAK